ncbi:MAG: transcription termination factor NusA, partial [bacterium]|nr:transcription termination factor NusA [bacterium]
IEKLKEKKIVPADEPARENFSFASQGGSSTEEEEQKKFVFNPEKHIMLDEAKKENSKIKLGEELEIPLISKQDYGRIAAQTAKQVILQKIREAEKETIAKEYKSKEGEIVSGIVQRIEGYTIFIDIGKTLGILNREEQIPGEFYRPGQRLKFYMLKVEDTPKGSVVMLSRAYPKLISKLFELEVPEIASGSVVIKAIARESGFRTKVAVESKEDGVDPIGSMVGQRGTRIMAVINELGGEKIDVVEWQKDPEKFIANSLAPAKIIEVKIEEKNTAVVFVPEDQLSLAIGKDGRNVRLAANLTGWKIDIKMSKSSQSDNEVTAEEQAKETKNKEIKETEGGTGEQKDEEIKPEEGKEKKKKSKKKSKTEETEELKSEEPSAENLPIGEAENN